MSVVAYFIGGPLDLTKRVLPDAPHASTRVELDNATEHLYFARPVEVRGYDSRKHFVYLYQGESNRA